ncbi:hypothetical protein BpHYR1_050438 [Brachionus plicatilis]|uniref:Uncharacterized protein n=1 Tax=Brachionus plicatilis TaxID=10195 RepID=A0A3M7R970_BRAPC|nr:hypothetical protein BpHYR1_050438 [Brachionus plicatilis]
MLDLAERSELVSESLGLGLSLQVEHLLSDQIIEQSSQVAPQQGLGGRYGQNVGQESGVESGLEEHEAAVNTGAAQIRRVLAQVNGSQPLHHAVISPQHHLGLVGQLVPARPPPQTLGLKAVQSEDVNGPFDAQKVQLAVYVQVVKVVVVYVHEHASIKQVEREHVLVLGQADVVQPLEHPVLVQLGQIFALGAQVRAVYYGLEQQTELFAVQRVLHAQLFFVVVLARLQKVKAVFDPFVSELAVKVGLEAVFVQKLAHLTRGPFGKGESVQFLGAGLETGIGRGAEAAALKAVTVFAQ